MFLLKQYLGENILNYSICYPPHTVQGGKVANIFEMKEIKTTVIVKL